MTLSPLVPKKGPHPFVVRRIKAFLRETGCEHARIVIKSDQEPAIIALRKAVSKARAEDSNAETIPEEAPLDDHASNGIAERCVQAVEEQVRVLRSALEKRLGAGLDNDSPIWAWLVEYAGLLLSRFEIGHDGLSSYERLK